MKGKRPLEVLDIVYEDGMFVSTCHACFLECKSRSKHLSGTTNSLSCRVGLREYVVKEGEKVRGRD